MKQTINAQQELEKLEDRLSDLKRELDDDYLNDMDTIEKLDNNYDICILHIDKLHSYMCDLEELECCADELNEDEYKQQIQLKTDDILKVLGLWSDVDEARC